MSKRVLVLASTFPAHDGDKVPAFVRDQIIAMKHADPSVEFHILAPHNPSSHTKSRTAHDHFSEHRFHYFWPHRFEKLAGPGGIMPTIQANPAYYALIPFLFVGEALALWRLTRQLNPVYLYAHWFTPQGVTAAWVGLLTRTPFVFTTHAADVDVWHKIPLIGPSIVRWHARRARAITAVSERSMHKLQAFFTEREWQKILPRTTIIPMGVMPQDQVVQPKSTLQTSYDTAGKTVLLFMGRLAEKKGVTYLLQALEQLRDPTLLLFVAGDGTLRSSLENEVRRRNLVEQVRFMGYVSGEQKAELLQLADIAILPSIITSLGDAEGLPVVFMEALAAALPTIATVESGADAFIHDSKNGFLVPQKDATAIASRIKQIQTLAASDLADLQQAAKNTSQQFSWPIVAKAHLDFFDSHLN